MSLPSPSPVQLITSRQNSSSSCWLLPELLQNIRQILPQPDFATLYRLSSGIYDRVNRILYESISLDLSGEKGFRTTEILQKSLEGSPERFCFLKSLHIRFRGLQKTEDFPTTQKEERHHLTILSNIVRGCSNLQELYILDRLPLPNSAVLDLGKSLNYVPSLLRGRTVAIF